MGKRTKKCRVCGKEYSACRNANMGDGVFRWQEVACSPECGAVYLTRVILAREAESTEIPSPVEYADEQPATDADDMLDEASYEDEWLSDE